MSSGVLVEGEERRGEEESAKDKIVRVNRVCIIVEFQRFW